jgi:hypothetical protein
MPASTFREVQYASGWVVLFLAGLGILLPVGTLVLTWLLVPRKNRALAMLMAAGVAAAAFLLCAAIWLFFGTMTTEVVGPQVRVRFGWLTSHAEAVSVADIRSAEVVRYDPVAEYGGWGIRRRAPNDRALNQRGDRGVRLRLADGQSLLIGSQQPEELADAIERARQEAGKNP